MAKKKQSKRTPKKTPTKPARKPVTKKITPKHGKVHAGKPRVRPTVKASSRKKTGRKGGPQAKGVIPGKSIYAFGKKTEGDAGMRALLGGKGANLAEMTRMGLPVPPGFTITTDTCAAYHKSGKRLAKDLMQGVASHMGDLEKQRGRSFGDPADPLLVSVRSGAAVSMPGMMDTILNLGLTDASVAGLAAVTGNERFAYDAYRRLVAMFGDVVMGIDMHHFERELDAVKAKFGVSLDTDVPAEGLKELCERSKAVYKDRCGKAFPQKPMAQLEMAIKAVFDSWMSEKAISYRRIEGMAGAGGTACSVQSMVFGNMGDDSGTGVAFTRNPSTGENSFYGEFLINAQGEDVVAGVRTPEPIDRLAAWNKAVYAQLLQIKRTLEQHTRNMQDIEFTVERGELFMLQTRTGKRTGAAAVKIACDMVREKLISEEEALLRIPAGDLTQLLLPRFDPAARAGADILTTGLPASPGAASGHPAFTAAEAVDRAHAGEKVILVRRETSPEDVDGMHVAAGVLTSTGGMTSHAAVVARGWGKCCIAGAGEIQIDEHNGVFMVGGRAFGRGDLISLDGTTGEVIAGSVATIASELSGDFARVMRWADKRRTLGVRTNADTPADAERARGFGAEGIGLTRTEHMFFDAERIGAMREMILADNRADREDALARLLPFQRADFVGIFTAMKGLPVTIRLLDPPLHEFLPHDEDAMADLARSMGVDLGVIRRRVTMLGESNPMLGHRGCRLAITYPEILSMQVRAIVEAAIDCAEQKIKVLPEIMIPLVGVDVELEMLRARTLAVIDQVKKERGFRRKLDIKIGTMIEVPRAAVTSEQIAKHADFFSFGTNDLTQMTFGYSRDDVNRFLPDYLSHEIIPGDPFQSIDRAGVGELVKMSVAGGRAGNPGIKLGICGEHGGDPASIRFCHEIGLDYVSCSPFRVPIARLAAAQAAIIARAQ
jgi:pyruvate, orthophosphate dikinase